MGRKNVLPLILCSEKKNSYIIVGISPLGTTRGAGDLSEEDQVRLDYVFKSVRAYCTLSMILNTAFPVRIILF